MKNKRVLFYIPEGNVETNGVYASQILGLARYLVTLGAECLIWQYLPNATHDDVVLEDGIRVLNDTFQRKYVPFCFQSRQYKKLSRRVEAKIRDFAPTHIYVRQYQTCLAVRALATKCNAILLYSVRGEDISERAIGGNLKDKIAAFYISYTVKKAVKMCDSLNTVSNVFATLLENRYKKRATVLPCCVDENLFLKKEVCTTITKQDLGFPKDVKVCVYSGGLFNWQKIDEIITLMKEISQNDTTIRFLFLTKDQTLLQQKCEAIGLRKDLWYGRACNQSEVINYLKVADCGIILRDDTLVNRVASPIKIGEYLAAGLAVIASPWIGDVGGMLTKKEFCLSQDTSTTVEDITHFLQGLTEEHKKHAIEFARSYYTFSGNQRVILEMFK